jgi:hypothetical protein
VVYFGVLMQNMRLVEAAMELAPCALGSGDSDLFARATGIDDLEESSVDELLPGPAESRDRGRR